MGGLVHDTRYAVRVLLKAPGYLAACLVTLALGIATTTVIFAVVDGALWRTLPYADADHIVQIQHRLSSGRFIVPLRVTPEELREWRAQAETASALATHRQSEYTLATREGPVRLTGSYVSANLFRLLGVPPLLGREFRADEEAAGSAPVVILSHATWATYFRSDPGILDTVVRLDDDSYEVVGVMPSDFAFPRTAAEFWVPARTRSADDAGEPGGGNRAGTLVARLRPETSLDRATAEAQTINARVEPSFEGEVEVWTLHRLMVSRVRRALLILLGAVGCVLLIVCANVTNLVLARAARRQPEVAIRSALGASRSVLVRQVLAETVVLGLAGGLLGSLLAGWGIGVVRTFGAGLGPRLDEIALDARVLLLAVGVSVVSGLLVGCVPALRLGWGNPDQALRPDSLSSASRSNPFGRRGASQLLVLAEVALAFVLLVGAGLLIRSFVGLIDVNLGYDPEDVLTFQVALPETRYADGTQQKEFLGVLLSRLDGVAAVRSVGMSTDLPFVGGAMFSMPAGAAGLSREEMQRRVIYVRAVSDGFFRAMGIPIVHGRAFVDGEAGQVVVVSETLASRHFPGEDPIDQELSVFGEPWRIVGVVADVRVLLDRDPPSGAYLPYQRFEGRGNLSSTVFAVRTTGDPLGLVPLIRSLVADVDPTIPIFDIVTMDQRVSDSVARPRFYAIILGVLAMVALAVATIGVYGVVSYLVTQRTGEIGIRIALGAQPGTVLRLVVRQGIVMIAPGLLVGLVGAVATTRYLESLLFGLTPLDPVTLGGVGLVLGVVALLACYLPGRRATQIDPVVALRTQ